MKKIFFLFIIGLTLASCARVGSPVGGDKDTLAPKFMASNIDSSRINVPRDIKELRIDFDEYINLKDINKNLIISPPITKIKKILPGNLSTKYLLIQWSDTLQANTTYNFNFGNAITDLNEGNILPYYNFAFSTGDKIDNLYISGNLTDALGEKKAENKEANIVVGLYQVKDTMDYRQKPYYITKVDPDGYYELNYLSPGKYRILGFEDLNQNSIFDPGKEKVAFQKDIVDLGENNISGLNLKLYSSVGKATYKEKKEIPGGLLFLFEGNPEKLDIRSVSPELKNYKVTHRPKSDSAYVWFDAVKENIGVDKIENMKFVNEASIGAKKDTIKLSYRFNPKQNDFVISRRGDSKIANTDLFKIASNLPIEKLLLDKFTLVSDSISQAFTAEVAKDDPFQINIKGDLKPGKKYQLNIPKESVQSYYRSIEKSYRFDFETEKAENLGSLTLTLLNAPEHPFWIQMLSTDGKVVYSKLAKEAKVHFANLKPGNYHLRILVDNNDNGVWDSADFEKETLAEDVYLFRKNKDTNPMTKVNIRPMWEINETWDLKNEVQTD